MPSWVIVLISVFCSYNYNCEKDWQTCVDNYWSEHMMVAEHATKIYAKGIKKCMIGVGSPGIIPKDN